MTPKPSQRAYEILQRVLDQDQSQQSAFLREIPDLDQNLRVEVELLLAQLRDFDAHTITSPTDFPADSAAPFPADARFRQRRKLGSGSFGIVYEAFDSMRGEAVAIKVLKDSCPEHLARFRDEFRAVEDVRHPNLVELGEFYSDNEVSFLTMELVRGRPFIEYVRPMNVPAGPCDVTRLASSLRQLCDGVNALHSANMLHRDLKPENVLVTEEGRVVILDFGLVLDLSPFGSYRSVAGSPAYMAPEQAAGRPERASDWFSVGVMLYEALTGVLPWPHRRASSVDRATARVPREIIGSISPDLSDLCMELISEVPSRRPSGRDVHERLSRLFGKDTDNRTESSSKGELFVGRHRESDLLRSCIASTLMRRTNVVEVCGSSGIGKSTLLRRFLLEVQQKYEHSIVLSGSCHQNETVPFKALDAVIVRLSRYLRDLSGSEIDSILPRDVEFVSHLFPVMRQIPAIARIKSSEPVTEALEFRRRAFQSLIELFGRLAMRRAPIVICLDDLQWGDLDSLAFLKELLTSSAPPPLLFIASYRIEDAETCEFLRILRHSIETADGAIRSGRIQLSDLPPQDAADMTRQLLPGCDINEQHAVAVESNGNPLLIHQYARHRVGMPEANIESLESMSLRGVIEKRISSLSPSARRLLQVIAVAGRPIPDAVAKEASLVPDFVVALERLCKDAFIRVGAGSRGRELCCFHDKIREITVATLSEAQEKAVHERLARALTSQLATEPSMSAMLAIHLERAERYEEAADRAMEAGDRFFKALAFDRAAELYEIALSVGRMSSDGVYALRRKLARALFSAGRGVAAAEEFERASRSAPDEYTKVDCLRLAADQYLRVGVIKKAFLILRDLAGVVGIRLIEHRWQAIGLFLFRRAILRLRGIRFKEKAESEIPTRQLMELDIYWSLVMGFSMVDPILGAAFHAKHLLVALRVGEPYRIGLSLALEVGHASLAGERRFRYAQQIYQVCTKIAVRINSAHVRGLATMNWGVAEYMAGRWMAALETSKEAVSILSRECPGAHWELATARVFWYSNLAWVGDWSELYERFTESVREASARGDVYAATSLRLLTNSVICNLAADQPEAARKDVLEALRSWQIMTGRGFDMQHFFATALISDTFLYSGHIRMAWEEFDGRWSEIKRFLSILRSDMFNVIAWGVRGKLAGAFAAVCEPEERDALLTELRTAAGKISGRKVLWAAGCSTMLKAVLAHRTGSVELCLRLLTDCQAEFEGSGLRMSARSAEWMRGSLIGGEAGEAMIKSAEGFMRQHGVVRPERIAQTTVPVLVPRQSQTLQTETALHV